MNYAERIIQKLNEFTMLDPLSQEFHLGVKDFAKRLWHDPGETAKSVVKHMPARYNAIGDVHDVIKGVKNLPSRLATGVHMLMNPDKPDSPRSLLRQQAYGDEEHRGEWNPNHFLKRSYPTEDK